ncbi:PHB depolymerase family esterase [Actinomadura sp. 7K507]|uniref:extracellular catalytic domain type 2 short-chain-length polyhydroxyalkanoate depolymerase n=1 Tax=Actinomadura sp. 7K507 TaxID=2530365 RepID=UPI001053CCE9|nr:PHB depolymerase family esterase [Actinomadura sp. 7K507]TDC97927.1 poly(3-hydroxybutyrate) depolymerase [Actinomadura sp. 7K507]
MRLRIRHGIWAAVAAAALASTSLSIVHAAVPPPVQSPLAEYDISGTYVSGVSSGGFMANQLHVAYSSLFQGAGIFSAGAYDCAQNSLSTALNACMATYLPRKTPAELQQLTRDRAAAGTVDPVQNLSGDPVWLYHGTSDTTVAEEVNDDLATYYRGLGAGVAYDRGSAAGHAWISPIGPNSCTVTQSPWINDCGGDAVGDMLTHLYGAVEPAAASLTGELIQFDQNAYVPGGDATSVSMGDEGFAYVPQVCEESSCTLMVALHGCYQYYGNIGDTFMDKAYLNEYADTNAMVVLYPQATASGLSNPRGCWDWWGYQSAQYPLKTGPQMVAVVNMVEAMSEGGTTPPTTPPTTTPPPTQTPACVTASNYAHTTAGRARQSMGYTYANGSDQNLGLWNLYTTSTIKETGPGHWVRC